LYLWYCRHHTASRHPARASRSRAPEAIASRNAISRTLHSDEPEPLAVRNSTGGVLRIAGAECTTGRGTGFATWTAGFAFFFTAGFAWRAFFAAFAFARVTACFGVAGCVGAELGVEAGAEEVTGADDVAGGGVTTGAGVEAGAGGGLEVCVLPLDDDLCC
jgi:hypothetical protein